MEIQEAKQYSRLPPQENPQEAKPRSDTASNQLNEAIERVDKLRNEVVEQRGLLVVGTIILLVMVGTLIVMVLLSWSDSNERVIDSNSALQQEIYELQLNAKK